MKLVQINKNEKIIFIGFIGRLYFTYNTPYYLNDMKKLYTVGVSYISFDNYMKNNRSEIVKSITVKRDERLFSSDKVIVEMYFRLLIEKHFGYEISN